MKFRDRSHAALLLAEKLHNADYPSVIFGIPRGGVVLADIIADKIGATMDILVPRKLGAPGNRELAMGAVMEDGTVYVNDRVVDALGISQDYIESEKARQMQEIERRARLYRKPGDNLEKLGDRSAVVVDDGIATGATVIVATRWIKKKNPKELVIATPVAPRAMVNRLPDLCGADYTIVLETPDDFDSVGQFYENFDPVSDNEVMEIMKKRSLL